MTDRTATDVTVLGLGAMGSALARALVGAGHRTVSLAKRLGWSRKTVGRCLSRLVQAGLVARSRQYHADFSLTSVGRRAVRLLHLNAGTPR